VEACRECTAHRGCGNLNSPPLDGGEYGDWERHVRIFEDEGGGGG
jgi:hypothetical protein